ncbi:MAG: hypothetical protein KAR24_00115 [Candidatus Pacebacteria bacterium]|nr:hypothetical protein [Candidatus Paceibacterota bacterium]
MNKKGSGLLIVLMSVAVVAIVFVSIYAKPAEDVKVEGFDETKSVFEQHTDLLEQAKDVKSMVEDKNKIE